MKTIIKISFLTFTLLLLTFSFAFAARPLSTDDTGTTALGGWKFEPSLSSTAFGSNRTSSLRLVTKYGLQNNMDIGVGFGIDGLNGVTGRGPIKMIGKYRFADGSSGSPSYAISGSVSVPESGDSQGTINGIMSQSMGNFIYHLNLGVLLSGFGRAITYGGAIDYPLNIDLNLVGELSGGNFGGIGSLGALVGAKWKIKDNVKLDCGLSMGFNDISSRGITIGSTILI